MRSDLYARKSSADAGRSAARQEREWRADCATESIEVGQAFADPDLSASRYAKKERPDYANLLAHIRSGRCEMVSVWEASRGSRDLGEWVAFLDLCRAHGVLIRVFEDGGQTFDPRRQSDRNELVRLGSAAETESATLSRRVTTGTRDAAAQGRPPGPLLYGYTREYGAPATDSVSAAGHRRREVRQVINETEAAVVRRLVDDTLAGVPLNSQAHRLNDEGVPTPSGRGKWTCAHLGRMLRNPGIAGDRVYYGEVVARDAWPGLIPRDQFRAVKAFLEAPDRPKYRNNALRYLLSGAAVCGVCDHPLRMQVRTGNYLCVERGCHRVGAVGHRMEHDVELQIVARLRQPDALAALTAPPDTTAIEAVKKELGDLREDLDGFYAQASRRKISPEGMAKIEAGFRPDIERLERKLRELSRPPTLRGLDNIDVAASWPDLDVAVRRSIILGLAKVILSPVGKGGRWSLARLGQSRWHGDDKTWAEHWAGA